MNNVLDNYRGSNETTYNALLCVIGGLMWTLFAIGLFAGEDDSAAGFAVILVYAVPITIFVLVSAWMFRAHAMGNMVLISEAQFPHIHRMVIEGAQKLGMSPPEAFIFNSGGAFNAFAKRALGRKYLLLTSAIVDATTDEQIRFIIGHELGHHAAGHLNTWLFLLRLPARLVPFLHKAYSRQCEYTCDRIGLYVSRDVQDSCTALSMLGCGCQRLNTQLNLSAFEQQEAQVPEVSGYLAEIMRTHPRLTLRVLALKSTRILD